MKLRENYNSDEKFKKLIDYLILIREKEKEKKNNEGENAEELLRSELIKATNLIQKKAFTDIEKMASAAAAGLLISNHSYGFGTGWVWNGSSWRLLVFGL